MLHKVHKMWIPGEELGMPEHEVNPELLRDAFACHVAPQSTEVVSISQDSLSALIPPKKIPRGFLFVDVDDFVGDLSGSLQAIQHPNVQPPQKRRNNHDYGENMFFTDDERDLKWALMALLKRSEAGMQPAPDIGEIRSHFQYMRASGVYISFLTATTPSSELATVENFLGRYFRGTCDGVVVVRGDYREVDKGMAAADVIRFVEEQVGQDIVPGTPVAALDDWPSHLQKIRRAVSDLGRDVDLKTIQYTFPSSQIADMHSVHDTSVLACVEHAADFLAAAN